MKDRAVELGLQVQSIEQSGVRREIIPDLPKTLSGEEGEGCLLVPIISLGLGLFINGLNNHNDTIMFIGLGLAATATLIGLSGQPHRNSN